MEKTKSQLKPLHKVNKISSTIKNDEGEMKDRKKFLNITTKLPNANNENKRNSKTSINSILKNDNSNTNILENNKGLSNNEFHESNNQPFLKEMIEKADIYSKAEEFISDTIELLTTNTLAFGREDAERYELIEKSAYVLLKASNSNLKDEEDTLIDEYNKLVDEQNNNFKDLTNLHKKFNTQEKLKNENMMKINHLKQKNRELIIKNEKLKMGIIDSVKRKENIFKTILFLNFNLNRKLPKELKEVINKIDKRSFQTNLESKIEKIQYLKKIEESLLDKLSKINKKPGGEKSKESTKKLTKP